MNYRLLVVLILTVVYMLPMMPIQVEAQTASVVFKETLLENPDWQHYYNGSVVLWDTAYHDGRFYVASDCSPTTQGKGLYVFSENGSEVASLGVCRDGGVDVDVHSAGIDGFLQFDGEQGIVRDPAPTTRVYSPVYYSTTRSQPRYRSRAFDPVSSGGPSGPNTPNIQGVAVANGYAVAWIQRVNGGEGAHNVVYELPSWDVVDTFPGNGFFTPQFTPVTGFGDFIIANTGGVQPTNQGAELWHVDEDGDLEFVRSLFTTERIGTYAIDPSNPNRIALRTADPGMRMRNEIHIFENTGEDLTLVETRTINTAPDTTTATRRFNQFAVLGNLTFIPVTHAETVQLPQSQSGRPGAIQVWRGGEKLETVILPHARARQDRGGFEVVQSDITGVAVSSSGDLFATTRYGAYLYEFSGALGDGGGTQSPVAPTSTPPGITPEGPKYEDFLDVALVYEDFLKGVIMGKPLSQTNLGALVGQAQGVTQGGFSPSSFAPDVGSQESSAFGGSFGASLGRGVSSGNNQNTSGSDEEIPEDVLQDLWDQVRFLQEVVNTIKREEGLGAAQLF